MSKRRQRRQVADEQAVEPSTTSLEAADGAPEVPESLPDAEAPVEKAEPAKPEKKEALVSLQVFATVGGPKWDQLAGFVRFAQASGLKPRTIAQWREELRKFNDRPVR